MFCLSDLLVFTFPGSSDVESYFTLCKWTSSSDEPEAELEDELPSDKSDSRQPPQHHGTHITSVCFCNCRLIVVQTNAFPLV